MTHSDRMMPLARAAVACNVCFESSPVLRAGIGMAQPFTLCTGYRAGGIVVVGINPGAAADGGYKEARKQALDRFRAGDDEALTEYWSALAVDADRFWNPRYLSRLRRLGLDIHTPHRCRQHRTMCVGWKRTSEHDVADVLDTSLEPDDRRPRSRRRHPDGKQGSIVCGRA